MSIGAVPGDYYPYLPECGSGAAGDFLVCVTAGSLLSPHTGKQKAASSIKVGDMLLGLSSPTDLPALTAVGDRLAARIVQKRLSTLAFRGIK